MTFKIIKGVATADVAYIVKSKTLEEVFLDSANALFSTMVDISTVGKKNKIEFNLESKKIDDLLIAFLEEIVFFKDSKNFIFSSVKIKIVEEKNSKYKINGQLFGEEINIKKHKLRSDVKAITLHMFKLEKTKKGWVAKLVFDI